MAVQPGSAGVATDRRTTARQPKVKRHGLTIYGHATGYGQALDCLFNGIPNQNR
jgi:hypothetical protein